MDLLSSYKSKRGQEQTYCEGFPMRKKYLREGDGTQVWRCDLKWKCPGRAESTPPDHEDLHQTEEHFGHEGDEEWVKVGHFSKQLIDALAPFRLRSARRPSWSSPG